MNRLLRLLSTVLVATLAFAIPAQAEQRTLTVYTYDAFTSDWGMAPVITPLFEQRCNCSLKFVSMDTSVGILNRVRLEGHYSQADLVLGLDMNLIAAAKATGMLATHQLDTSTLTLPITWNDPVFVPFDYGYFAFVYNTEQLPNPPRSLQELVAANNDLKVIIQDPRTSTPGLGLILWMKSVYGNQAGAAWTQLSNNILATTKNWSEAYFSLFMAGEAPMVLSYSTSPAYHMAIENNHQYQAIAFDEGHYLQVEVAAVLKDAPNPDLAHQFLEFMVSPQFQQAVPLTNMMYPVIDLGDALPAEFDQLIKPAKVLQLDQNEVAHQRQKWVAEWLEAMSH
jgi:thiamine transport system substrate-binding protein